MNTHETNLDSSRVDEARVDRNTPPGRAAFDAPPAQGLKRGTWIGLLIVAIVLAVVVVLGIASRAHHDTVLATDSKQSAISDVAVIHPQGSSVSDEIALPGNTQAFMDTPIYSRTSGYLKSWYFDIGAHVRKGQLMAQIETPELDQQLQVAQADLKSAQANLNLANTTSERYQNLLKTNSVSKQETDVAVSDASAKQAAVDASLANVRRLTQLQSFENIYAPFDGIVTARNTDVGALIEAGANTVPKELFHLAAIGRIRVFVAVPETYSATIRNDAVATLTLDEYPGQRFEGKVARNSNQIDQASRTLNVEVDIDNSKGLLLPGAYVFVHFKVPDHVSSLTVPANTLLFRAQGLQVALVRDGEVHLQRVTIAQDMGASVEIGSGLQASDQVIVDPSDSIAEGQHVRITDHSGAAKPAGAQ